LIVAEPSGKAYNPWSNDYSEHCYAGDLPFRHAMKMVEQGLQDYKELPKFYLEAYEDHHNSDQTGITLYDEDLRNHIASLPLEDTVLVLMGDHGLGFSKYAYTKKGQHDYHNPIFLMAWPKRVLDMNPEWRTNLHQNTDKLVTVLDLHATLRGVAEPFLKDEAKKKTNWLPLSGWNFPGMDLTKNVVPKQRNCASAMIPPQFCDCGEWSDVSIDPWGPEFSRSLLNQSVWMIVERGLLTSSANQFYKLCYVDAEHVKRDGIDRKDGFFSSSNFDIMSFQVFQNPFEIKSGLPEREFFLLVIQARTSRSPKSIAHRFEIVGVLKRNVDDGGGAASIEKVLTARRISVYAHEPCALHQEFCICLEGTDFTS
jgi:hypothetical protein